MIDTTMCTTFKHDSRQTEAELLCGFRISQDVSTSLNTQLYQAHRSLLKYQLNKIRRTIGWNGAFKDRRRVSLIVPK